MRCGLPGGQGGKVETLDADTQRWDITSVRADAGHQWCRDEGRQGWRLVKVWNVSP
jgi:hypothetical protein